VIEQRLIHDQRTALAASLDMPALFDAMELESAIA